jgi:hypothetical protein
MLDICPETTPNRHNIIIITPHKNDILLIYSSPFQEKCILKSLQKDGGEIKRRD